MDEMLNKSFAKFTLGFIAIVLVSLVVIAVSSIYLQNDTAITEEECVPGETC